MHKNDRVHLTHIRIQIKEKICYEYFLFFFPDNLFNLAFFSQILFTTSNQG